MNEEYKFGDAIPAQDGKRWSDDPKVYAMIVENERLREALYDISISQNSMYQEARAKQALGEDQNIWKMCGLNTDDVIKMAEEAGIVMSLTDERVTLSKLNRFLELHLKALKNEGYRQCAEGQRTTQYCGLLDVAVRAEHEACKEMIAAWVEDWCEGWSAKKIAHCIRGDGNDTVKPNKYVTKTEPL